MHRVVQGTRTCRRLEPWEHPMADVLNQRPQAVGRHPIPVSVMYPSAKRMNRWAKVFVDWLTRYLKHKDASASCQGRQSCVRFWPTADRRDRFLKAGCLCIADSEVQTGSFRLRASSRDAVANDRSVRLRPIEAQGDGLYATTAIPIHTPSCVFSRIKA